MLAHAAENAAAYVAAGTARFVAGDAADFSLDTPVGLVVSTFDETVFNTVFAIADVLAALRALGFAAAHAALLADLDTPLADPEREGRVFLVAHL
jgi:hypothetical protein